MKRRWKLGLLFVVGLVVGATAFVALRPREPVYQGKRLSEWVKIYANSTGTDQKHAVLAIRQAGTNALPTLLRMLRSRDSWAKVKLMQLASKQSLIKFDFTSEHDRRYLAVFAIQELGPAAKPALPALIELLNNADTTSYAKDALVPLSANFLEREEELLLAASFTNENPEVRENVISLLGGRGGGAVAAALIQRLQETDRGVRLSTIESLVSLRAIHPSDEIAGEFGLVVRTLAKTLQDDSPAVRSAVALALCQFGLDAQQAVPYLLKHVNDPDERVRQDVALALRTIDPEAAASAGVK